MLGYRAWRGEVLTGQGGLTAAWLRVRPKMGDCQGHTSLHVASVLREIKKLPLASLRDPFTYC